MLEEPPKSLDRWRFELKSIGKKHWLSFYESMLGSQCSSPARLYRLLNLYGDWMVFDAIIDSSQRTLTGDPLGYITKVTHEKWKSSQQEADADARYLFEIERAKEESLRRNQALEKKLRRGRKK